MSTGSLRGSSHRFARCASDRPLRRFLAWDGRRLTIEQIRGPWRPSGSVAGAGVFAVVWETHSCTFWAPLHDFYPTDQLRLIEACRWLDQVAGHPAPGSDRRCN